MPKFSRSGQDWILDRFVASLGINALMPGFATFASSPVVGYNVADVQRIAERTRGMLGMRREYLRAATRRERLAREAEAGGHEATARRQYHLAALYYGFAQYTIQEDGSIPYRATRTSGSNTELRAFTFADRLTTSVMIVRVLEITVRPASVNCGLLVLSRRKSETPSCASSLAIE